MEKKKRAKIPKLEIEKFTFSPPGRMGWSYSEYENMMNQPEKILKESEGNESPLKLMAAELMEFPFGQKHEFNWEEEMKENSLAIKSEAGSSEEMWNDMVPSFNQENESIESIESIESAESYDYVNPVGIEAAEELEEPDEVEEEPVAEKKMQIIILTVGPPKPPWIASNLRK